MLKSYFKSKRNTEYYIKYLKKHPDCSDELKDIAIDYICTETSSDNAGDVLNLYKKISLSQKQIGKLANAYFSSTYGEYRKDDILKFLNYNNMALFNEFINNIDNCTSPDLLIYILKEYTLFTEDTTEIIIDEIIEHGSYYSIYNTLMILNDNPHIMRNYSAVKKLVDKLKDLSIEKLIEFSKTDLGRDFITKITDEVIKYSENIVCDFAEDNENINCAQLEKLVNRFLTKTAVDEKYIVEFIKIIKDIPSDRIIPIEMKKFVNQLTSKVEQSGNITAMVEALNEDRDNEYVSKDTIKTIINEYLLITFRIDLVYEFLVNNQERIDKEDRKKLITKIINSKNLYYICLTALYVEPSIIKDLFKNATKFLIIISTLQIDEDEKEELKNRAFTVITGEETDSKKSKKVIEKTYKRIDKYVEDKK